ncbi:MAG: class F sortase [Dehalococcoidia bacterium]|nr:class F sortase [Dehalococcoidia bacterium]
MRERLSKIDRRLAVTGLVLVTSMALLLVGLVSILVTLSDDNVDLPNEGSLEEIVSESAPSGASGGGQTDGPAPTRIAIPKIGVDAAVQAMGRDPQNYPAVPGSGSDVAWYTFTAAPGRGSNAVFSGHVDWYYWGEPGEGVFYHLRELQIGDEITVDLADGNQVRYRVTGNVAVAYDDQDIVKVMDPTSKDVVTLITCGGTWLRDYSNPAGGNYSHRVIVRAERVSGLASEQAGSEG